MVAVEEGQKAGLRAGRPLRPAEFEVGEPVLDLLQVEYQVVTPKRGPLADRCRLGRLQVREAEARQIAVRCGEFRQDVDGCHQPAAEDFQSLPHQDQIGVIRDVTARRAEVDDAPRIRTTVTIRVDMGHHVVPQLPLVLGGPVEIDVVDGGFQLGDLGLR